MKHTILTAGVFYLDTIAVKDMTEGLVREGLEEAQKNASRSVGYLGSKGMIHAQMK